MPNKGELSVDEKVKVVFEYLSVSIRTNEVKCKFGISKGLLREWVRICKARGLEGVNSYNSL